MVEPEVAVAGLSKFRRDLKRTDAEVDKELRKEIKDSAEKVLARARAATPRSAPTRWHTGGYLARSLQISVTARRASIYSTLPYAPVVHWGGTIRPRGVPITFKRTEFLSDAAVRGADQLAQDIVAGVERAALRTGWH